MSTGPASDAIQPEAPDAADEVRGGRRSRASHARYDKYLKLSRERSRNKGRLKDEAPRGLDLHESRSSNRSRPMPELIRAFWGFLKGQRLRLALALGILTVTTALNLTTFAAPKPIVDNVLIGDALPGWVGAYLPWVADLDRRSLLTLICAGVALAAVIGVSLNTLGRWTATKAAARVKVGTRRVAYEHAVKLPLHRVYSIKSGGVASLLRDDANGVGDLVFQMIYNPWQAPVQLVIWNTRSPGSTGGCWPGRC